MLHAFSRFTLLVPLSKRTPFRTHLFPLPQHPRPLAFRPHSHLSYGDFKEKRRIYRLVLSVRYFLKREMDQKALNYFKEGVSRIPPKDRTTRFCAYERGISAFLRHKTYNHAIELYRQMFAERFFSSSGLRAKVLVCSDIVAAPHEQQEKLELLYEKLSHVVSLASYSERSLCQLLDVMSDHPLIDVQFVHKLVDVYLKSRGPQYYLESHTINKLILFYVHAGGVDSVERLVSPHLEPAESHSRHRNAGPYTTLISELTKKDAMSAKRLGLLLDRMKQSHTEVDLPLMNALVQSAIHRRDLRQAFTLYETMIRDPAPHMIPDSITFWSLFNAFRRLWISRRRSGHRTPKTHVIRKLFRQMLECHVLAVQAAADTSKGSLTAPPSRPVVCVSTLNVALELFMLAMDYRGAFVTLQTFRGLGFRPDASSYRAVLTTLLAHIKVGLEPRRSELRIATWATNFLGSEVRARVQAEDIRPELVGALLEFAKDHGDTGFRTPSVAVILEDEKEPKNVEWDIEPLERLLARAVLSYIKMKGLSEVQAERVLREKLAPTLYQMVPERLSKGRRLRWSAY
ncbi:hypothetical protein V8E53_001984 [Lactarius tabidus]